MFLPVEVRVVICEYVVVISDIVHSVYIEDSNTPEDYLQVLFNDHTFDYLIHIHKNQYGKKIRYLDSVYDERISQCTNLITLCTYKKLPACLPKSLSELILYRPQQDVILPDTLETLILRFYNRKLPILPKNLKTLGLLDTFNQPFSSDTFKNIMLKNLITGTNFNSSLTNLPLSLEYLVLGRDFNRIVRLNNYKSLKFLGFKRDFNKYLINVNMCTYLTFAADVVFTVIRYVPFVLDFPNILFLCIDILGISIKYYGNVDCLPPVFNVIFFLTSLMKKSFMCIPLGVSLLGYLIEPTIMPHIYFRQFYTAVDYQDYTKKNLLSYVVLEFILNFLSGKIRNAVVKHYSRLPQHLVRLRLGDCWNKPLYNGMFPNTITHLMFGENFSYPIVSNLITGRLENTLFGKLINRFFSVRLLPKNLEYLELGRSFVRPIYDYHLPKTMKILYVSSTYPHENDLRHVCDKRNIQLRFV